MQQLAPSVSGSHTAGQQVFFLQPLHNAVDSGGFHPQILLQCLLGHIPRLLAEKGECAALNGRHIVPAQLAHHQFEDLMITVSQHGSEMLLLRSELIHGPFPLFKNLAR